MTARRGFTLLEVLVVLTITGMLAAVLMQAFGFILTIRTGVLNKIVGLERTVVTRNLYLAPLQSLVPDYPEKPDVFVGTERRIHGLTTSPLQNRPGAPVGFDLYFEYGVNQGRTTLMYRERGRDPVALGGWEGDTGRFTYRDRIGGWLDVWPPRTVQGEKPSQTPWVIRIEMGTGFPAAVATAVTGAHDRVIRMQDTPMGADMRPSDLRPN